MELAVRFVVRESAGLATALRAPNDRAAVGSALRWHEGAHRPWLSLLAACRRADWPSAHGLARLYAYHGRLVELLEQGLLTDPATGAAIAGHLQQRTGAVIDRLRADAASHAQRLSRPEPDQAAGATHHPTVDR